MIPRFYFDVEALRVSDITMHDIMSIIVQKVHHATRFGQVALAFPTLGDRPGLGDRVRVFAENKDVLEQIARFLSEDWRIGQYTAIHPIGQVPEAVDKYESFHRFRMSHGISESRKKRLAERGMADKLASFNDESRKRQRAMLNDRSGRFKIGFASIFSATTRRQFNLYIERRACEKPGTNGTPDGYGLSRKGNVIALPVL